MPCSRDVVVGDMKEAARACGGADERDGGRAREGELNGREGDGQAAVVGQRESEDWSEGRECDERRRKMTRRGMRS